MAGVRGSPLATEASPAILDPRARSRQETGSSEREIPQGHAVHSRKHLQPRMRPAKSRATTNSVSAHLLHLTRAKARPDDRLPPKRYHARVCAGPYENEITPVAPAPSPPRVFLAISHNASFCCWDARGWDWTGRASWHVRLVIVWRTLCRLLPRMSRVSGAAAGRCHCALKTSERPNEEAVLCARGRRALLLHLFTFLESFNNQPPIKKYSLRFVQFQRYQIQVERSIGPLAKYT